MFDGKFGIQQWVDADPRWLTENAGFLRAAFGQPTTPPPDDPTQSFDDREQSYAGYAKANFGFDLGTVPVDGNVGLRVVDTQANMKGNSLVVINGIGVITPTVSDKDTLDWLPSLNMRFSLEDDLLLRFAASQTITHPTFPQLNPGLTLSASTATLLGSGAGGNPDLSPVKSENVDLSLEYYFGPQNVLTGAVFYRNIDGYIQLAQTEQTINGIDYQITIPVNAPAGHIDGAEVG
jgi:TonB-dependent receptor